MTESEKESDDLLKNLGLPAGTKKEYLSETSKNTYRLKLTHLAELTGKPLPDALVDVRRTSDLIAKTYPKSVTSQKGVVTAISSVLKRSPNFAKKHANARQSWLDVLTHLNEAERQVRGDNRITAAQRKKMATSSEIRKALRKLKAVRLNSLRLSQHYLLLRMMIDIPPKRLDFNDLNVFPGPAPALYKGNYITLPSKGAANLTLQQFKTAKRFGSLHERIPAELTSEIRQSLKLYPRARLFVGRSGTGMSESAYSAFIRRVFIEHIGKPCTINALRHAYISEFVGKKHTYNELSATARSMCHSTDMQQQYNVLGFK
jgi:hypothetical protein